MKVLFDECVPWPLHSLLSEHECASANASHPLHIEMVNSDGRPGRVVRKAPSFTRRRDPVWGAQAASLQRQSGFGLSAASRNELFNHKLFNYRAFS